jgi:hypothetical protein
VEDGMHMRPLRQEGAGSHAQGGRRCASGE